MSDHRPATVPRRLIDGAKAGDQRSFDALFHAYQPGLMRYLRTVAPSHAGDVAGATWESVASSIHRFRGDGDGFRSWLFTIARRRLTDEIRRAARRPLHVAEPPEVADDASVTDPVSDEAEWAEAVLRSIPTRQADAVALRVIGGLSVDETAALLGITAANVRVLCHRGLRAIAAILEDDRGGDVVSATSEEFLSVV